MEISRTMSGSDGGSNLLILKLLRAIIPRTLLCFFCPVISTVRLAPVDHHLEEEEVLVIGAVAATLERRRSGCGSAIDKKAVEKPACGRKRKRIDRSM